MRLFFVRPLDLIALTLSLLYPVVAAADTFHIYPTENGGTSPDSGDFKILQDAIDAAEDGDTIVMMDTLADGVTPAIWTPGGDLVDDFDVFISRNGVPVGGTQKYSRSFPVGAAARFGVPPGRGISIGKALTIRGNGVDASGVPRTRIGGDFSFDFNVFKAVTDQSGDLIAVLVAATSRTHGIVLHHKRSKLKNLMLENTSTTFVFAHPGAAKNIHVDGGLTGISAMIDDRSVYPNLVHGGPILDFSNPERSLIKNCKMRNVWRAFDALSFSGLTIRGCDVSGYFAVEGVINLIGIADIPLREGWVDFKQQIMSDIHVENSTIEERNAAPSGGNSAILAFLLGSDVISERVTIRNNTIVDVASTQDFGFNRNGIHWLVDGATVRDSKATGNEVLNAAIGVNFAAFNGGTIQDSRISNNDIQVSGNFTTGISLEAFPGGQVSANKVRANEIVSYSGEGSPGIEIFSSNGIASANIIKGNELSGRLGNAIIATAVPGNVIGSVDANVMRDNEFEDLKLLGTDDPFFGSFPAVDVAFGDLACGNSFFADDEDTFFDKGLCNFIFTDDDDDDDDDD